MLYANIIFKPCVKKYIYTYIIGYVFRGVTRGKMYLEYSTDVAAFLRSRMLAIKNVERYICKNTKDFIFVFHDTAV